ncbi:unnamed protein product [Bubo scandiacus]
MGGCGASGDRMGLGGLWGGFGAYGDHMGPGGAVGPMGSVWGRGGLWGGCGAYGRCLRGCVGPGSMGSPRGALGPWGCGAVGGPLWGGGLWDPQTPAMPMTSPPPCSSPPTPPAPSSWPPAWRWNWPPAARGPRRRPPPRQPGLPPLPAWLLPRLLAGPGRRLAAGTLPLQTLPALPLPGGADRHPLRLRFRLQRPFWVGFFFFCRSIRSEKILRSFFFDLLGLLFGQTLPGLPGAGGGEGFRGVVHGVAFLRVRGVSTSHEHVERYDFPSEWIAVTFSRAAFWNNVIAVGAGGAADFFAEGLGLGPVAPFMVSIPLLVLSGVFAVKNWDENYGKKRAFSKTCGDGLKCLLSDRRVLLLGTIQALFESVIYIFIFLWTPVLDPHGAPLGIVFSAFMAASTLGSSLYRLAVSKRYHLQPVHLLSLAVLLVFFSLFMLAFSTSPGQERPAESFLAFLLIELSCGLYFPAMGFLRRKVVPEKERLGVMNWFRLPLNLLACLGLLVLHDSDRQTGTRSMFGGCAAAASERFLRVLAESCQFLVSSLSEYVKRSRQQPLGQEDVLGLCAFTEGHCRVLRRLLQRVPSDGVKQKLAVKQLLYRSLQLFASAAYDAFQCSQLAAGWPGLERLTRSCRRSVGWMLQALEGLPEGERAKYLDITVSCTFKLAYIFYNQNLHQEASSVCELFCQSLQAADASRVSRDPPGEAAQMLPAAGGKLPQAGAAGESPGVGGAVAGGPAGPCRELLAEPVSLWVRVKMDAAKQGAEELRLRTLKEGLEGHSLDTETLVTVLFAELKAYKTLRADTGQERYNVLCDLLAICSEESGRLHERAVGLTELAQVLCYHSYAQQTDCSSLDSVREALRLLELVPSSAQNHDRLLDDRAQALLWLYICTLESKLEERLSGSARFWIRVSQTRDVPSALCQSLDDAFALWKQLLTPPGVPAVRSPRADRNLPAPPGNSLQADGQGNAAGEPLQALESYLLARALCGALGDSLGTASALCQVTKLLFQLECPSYAQLFLEETESCLQKGDSGDDSHLLLQQTCLLLRSQLCCVNHGVRLQKALFCLKSVSGQEETAAAPSG